MKLKIIHVQETHLSKRNLLFRMLLKYGLIVLLPTIVLTLVVQKRKKDKQQLFIHEIITKTKVVRLPKE